MQHFERGGVNVAPFSSSVSERGRWIIQICPCESTVMPPTWPRIQLFGSGFGQDGSTANLGISLARVSAGCADQKDGGDADGGDFGKSRDAQQMAVAQGRRHGVLPCIFLVFLSEAQ